MFPTISATDWLLTSVGIIGGAILGFALTLAWQYASRRRLQLLYQTSEVAFAHSAKIEGLKYIFEDKEIPGFYTCRLYLQSFSNQTLEASALSTPGKLSFFVTDGEVLHAYLSGEKLHSKAEVEIGVDRKSVVLSFDRIASDDGFLIYMLCDSPLLARVQCQTYVVDRRRAVRRMRSFNEQFFVFAVPFMPALFWFMAETTFQFPPPVEMTAGLTISMAVLLICGYGGGLLAGYEYLLGKKAKMRRLHRRFTKAAKSMIGEQA